MVKLNRVNLNRADIEILRGMAITMHKYIDSSVKEGGYNSEKYGEFKNTEKWPKHKLINWLLQFDLKITEKET